MNKKLTLRQDILLISVVAAIAYLPLARQIGYMVDDWYLMYDMQVKGPAYFHEIFGIDRPGRAFLMIPLFQIFGFEPLGYHISAFLFRLLGGISLLWTLQNLWNERNFFTTAAAILFTVYPGFLSMPNAIDYQSHIFGLFLAILSIGLTVQSIIACGRKKKTTFAIAAILTGWGYLSQMEYFIGIEVFRFSAIVLLLWREEKSTREKAKKILLASLPFLLIAIGFLTWRLFFFESERKATDISAQTLQVLVSPMTALWWLNYLMQDFFTVTFTAWGLPLYQLAFPMRLRDMAAAAAWSAGAVFLLALVMQWKGKAAEAAPRQISTRHARETLLLGFISMAGGLLPVILVNRHVILPDYSRYSLIASIGAAILLALVLEQIRERSAQITLLACFVFIAVMTHYGNAVRHAAETQATRNFWWQVAWRAPSIRPGTTLIASYPNSPLSEDYFIWGPANFIYYPEPQSTIPLQIKLPAAVLNDETALQIAFNGGTESPLRRGNYLERNFGNVLVMAQSTPNSCVRIINGNAPELSQNDPLRIYQIASFSRIENIEINSNFKTPPAYVFGKEPPRDWCFYYQKADLARQRGEWNQVLSLLNEALAKGYYPNDSLEWMPFLQAYALQGNTDEMRRLATLLTADKLQRTRTCQIMSGFSKNHSLPANAQDFIQNKICK